MKMQKKEAVKQSGCLSFGTKLAMFALCFILFGMVGMISSQAVKAADPVEGVWVYRAYGQEGVKIVRYTGGSQNETIPSMLGGKPVVALGLEAFRDNQQLITVTIPSTVKTIEATNWDGCFRDCRNLTEVIGLENVTLIGSRAFLGCSNLKKVTFGEGLKEIGNSAFEGCTILEQVVLPSTLETIGSYAFKNCDALTSVTIPSSVTTFSREAFAECDSLASVEMNATLEKIGDEAFRDCPVLSSVSLAPTMRLIGKKMFQKCPLLTTVSLSESIQSIGDYAFERCSSLDNLVIPSSVRYLSVGVFANCTSLSNLQLKYGLIDIGNSAFAGCVSLTAVDVPNSVIRLGSEAFANCAALTDVFLPYSVTNIQKGWSASFAGSKQVVISCYHGSYASDYVSEMGIEHIFVDSIPSTGFAFTNSSIQMKVGQTLQIGYTIQPVDTTDAIVWTSSASDIIEVNAIGEITAKRSGTVSIIAISTTGTRLEIPVTAVYDPDRISFRTRKRVIQIGETYTQTAEIRDPNGIRNDLTPVYTSSNPAIATVDGAGTVTGVSPGVVTITATIQNLTASYEVTVATPKPGNEQQPGANPGNTKPGTGSQGNGSANQNKNQKAISKLKISKSGKTLKITTIKGAKVKVSAKKAILGKSSKTVTANKKGIAKITFKKKIKKVTVTIKVSKSGYKTRTTKKKFK